MKILSNPGISMIDLFINWYSDAEFKKVFNFDTLVVKDITIYAKWKINKYTVTFNVNSGGSCNCTEADGLVRSRCGLHRFIATNEIHSKITIQTAWRQNHVEICGSAG